MAIKQVAAILRGPRACVHPDASTILKRALTDLATLVDEGAPRAVISAANYATDCAKAGITPQAWAYDTLLRYARERARQDRYTVAVRPGAPQ